MAIDEWLLEMLEAGGAALTVVRFYEWTRPTLSLGQHQKMDRAADVGYCASRGIDIVYRPTGGRAVLHDRELTYAIVSNDRDIFNSASVLTTYKRIANALCRGLQRLGVAAVLADSPMHALEAPENPVWVKDPCFNSPSRYELMVGDRKLIGSAQKRLQRSFLQHGSLLLDCDVSMLAHATRADAKTLAQKITTLQSLLGRPILRPEIEAALLRGFSEEFSIAFQTQPITDEELAASQHLKDIVSQGVSA
jgi:lipoate-protein ligase A